MMPDGQARIVLRAQLHADCPPHGMQVAKLESCIETTRIEAIRRELVQGLVQGQGGLKVLRVHIFTSGGVNPIKPPTLDLFDMSASKLWLDVPFMSPYLRGASSSCTSIFGDASSRTCICVDAKEAMLPLLIDAAILAGLGNGPFKVAVADYRLNNTFRISHMPDGEWPRQMSGWFDQGHAFRACSAVWLAPASELPVGHFLLFLKFHLVGQPISSFLSLGHAVVNPFSHLVTILDVVRERASLAAGATLWAYEEVEYFTQLTVRPLQLHKSLLEQELESGDVLWFQAPSSASDTVPVRLEEWIAARPTIRDASMKGARANAFFGDAGYLCTE